MPSTNKPSATELHEDESEYRSTAWESDDDDDDDDDGVDDVNGEMEDESSNLSVRKKEGNVLYNDTLNILFTVIWHQTYDKGTLR